VDGENFPYPEIEHLFGRRKEKKGDPNEAEVK